MKDEFGKLRTILRQASDGHLDPETDNAWEIVSGQLDAIAPKQRRKALLFRMLIGIGFVMGVISLAVTGLMSPNQQTVAQSNKKHDVQDVLIPGIHSESNKPVTARRNVYREYHSYQFEPGLTLSQDLDMANTAEERGFVHKLNKFADPINFKQAVQDFLMPSNLFMDLYNASTHQTYGAAVTGIGTMNEDSIQGLAKKINQADTIEKIVKKDSAANDHPSDIVKPRLVSLRAYLGYTYNAYTYVGQKTYRFRDQLAFGISAGKKLNRNWSVNIDAGVEPYACNYIFNYSTQYQRMTERYRVQRILHVQFAGMAEYKVYRSVKLDAGVYYAKMFNRFHANHETVKNTQMYEQVQSVGSERLRAAMFGLKKYDYGLIFGLQYDHKKYNLGLWQYYGLSNPLAGYEFHNRLWSVRLSYLLY